MASSDPDSRLLLLMRHGKAESSAPTDADRPLTDRGHAQSRLVGEYLEAQGVRPSRVLVSTAVRTRETWDSVLSAMPGFTGKATFSEDIYSGGGMDILDLVRARKDKHKVIMVIGHEPTISGLARGLAGAESDPGSLAQTRIGLPTGALCVLSGELSSWADLSEGAMTLHTIVRA